MVQYEGTLWSIVFAEKIIRAQMRLKQQNPNKTNVQTARIYGVPSVTERRCPARSGPAIRLVLSCLVEDPVKAGGGEVSGYGVMEDGKSRLKYKSDAEMEMFIAAAP